MPANGTQRYCAIPSPSIRPKSATLAVTMGMPSRSLVQNDSFGERRGARRR
ncbi:hypothetical protein I553_9573 [Mycobacterium xenopi 4042]|uniref:Uncharacterized protein n=1 Tax=Mycobacterium xenopi 4042 TaxID=1299334 RepID=X8DXN7_MYCXE|nr:hypothetical protein I552_1119 [Mycobacterium xenopi 3993]EUA73417.1 hypothetical protein I553_9573 [Mycobacterium xenopi 4042]